MLLFTGSCKYKDSGKFPNLHCFFCFFFKTNQKSHSWHSFYKIFQRLITVMISPSDDLETSIEHLYKLFHFITCDQKLKKYLTDILFIVISFRMKQWKQFFFFLITNKKKWFYFQWEKKKGRLSSFRKLRNKNYTHF